MATALNPRKKYRDSHDGRVQTGAAWTRELEELVREDREEYGIKTPSVKEYIELYTMCNGEYDHQLKEVTA